MFRSQFSVTMIKHYGQGNLQERAFVLWCQIITVHDGGVKEELQAYIFTHNSMNQELTGNGVSLLKLQCPYPVAYLFQQDHTTPSNPSQSVLLTVCWVFKDNIP